MGMCIPDCLPEIEQGGGNWLKRHSVTPPWPFPRDVCFWKVSVRACAVCCASIHLAPAVCQAPCQLLGTHREMGQGPSPPGGPSGPPGRWTGSQEPRYHVMCLKGAQPSGPEKG